MSLVRTDHFFGIDINAFAVEIAKVTLMLGKQLAAIELGDEHQVLPLDDLDGNFIADDALFCEWPEFDACIGNPPYLGRRKLIQERAELITPAVSAMLIQRLVGSRITSPTGSSWRTTGSQKVVEPGLSVRRQFVRPTHVGYRSTTSSTTEARLPTLGRALTGQVRPPLPSQLSIGSRVRGMASGPSGWTRTLGRFHCPSSLARCRPISIFAPPASCPRTLPQRCPSKVKHLATRPVLCLRWMKPRT